MSDSTLEPVDQTIAGLLRRHGKANDALFNGEIERRFELVPHASDFTLMSPFGGAPTRGHSLTPDRVANLKRFFRWGTSEMELVHAISNDDLAVLVLIERQRARVAEIAEQDWSLRVTVVYRRCVNSWQLVHRHADSLVRGISVDHAAAIARGDGATLPS